MTKQLEMVSAENAKLGSVFRDDMANQNDERINEYQRQISQMQEKLHLTEQYSNDKINALQNQ